LKQIRPSRLPLQRAPAASAQFIAATCGCLQRMRPRKTDCSGKRFGMPGGGDFGTTARTEPENLRSFPSKAVSQRAATGTSHDQLDKDHRHNAADRART
jgi:hypothetical protein